MQQVVSPIRIVKKILGEQKTAGGTPYRLSTHSIRLEQPEGVLLYHTLTGELLLLSHEEAALLGELPGPVPPALKGLVSQWFLRPEGADDVALADQVRQIAERFRKKDTALTRYTIFTTLDCNARCFYCYEAGWGKGTMTEQTALDTAAYIAAHREGKPVWIQWFGGEPLVNVKAIDVISDSLRRHGVEFRSDMATNGYFIDETLAARIKNDWHLERVQITLDGTEEVYNARKAYVNPQGSPYQRVLRNIGLLLAAGVPVRVRMNMDGNNERDLYALVDQLGERFGSDPGFEISLTLIWEGLGFDPVSFTEEERRIYADKVQALRDYAREKGIASHVPLGRTFIFNACSVDSDGSTTVMPDGRLGRCPVSKSDSIWGSIYSDQRDEEVLRQWREHKAPEEICGTCALYPRCIRSKKCVSQTEHCSAWDRSYRASRYQRAILEVYENWKAAGQT